MSLIVLEVAPLQHQMELLGRMKTSQDNQSEKSYYGTTWIWQYQYHRFHFQIKYASLDFYQNLFKL